MPHDQAFEIKCLQCKSTDVDVRGDVCEDDGGYVIFTCNGCGAEYDTHTGEWTEGSK